MVRHKTQGGAPAEPSTPIPGQTYGNGVQQQQLANAMPAPDNRAVATPAPVQTGAAPAPGNPDIGALLQLAQGQGSGAGLLTSPTSRPTEPITSGLPIGAGPGAEAIGFATSTPGGRFLRRLAQATGDQFFAQLADRSGQ